MDVKLAEAEYEQFCISYQELIQEKEVIKDLQDMLQWFNEHDLQNAHPNLAILYRIFGTIAFSSASTGRTFSKLRIIKSYLRSTMRKVT